MDPDDYLRELEKIFTNSENYDWTNVANIPLRRTIREIFVEGVSKRKPPTSPTYGLAGFSLPSKASGTCAICGKPLKEGDKIFVLWFYIPLPVDKVFIMPIHGDCFVREILPLFDLQNIKRGKKV